MHHNESEMLIDQGKNGYQEQAELAQSMKKEEESSVYSENNAALPLATDLVHLSAISIIFKVYLVFKILYPLIYLQYHKMCVTSTKITRNISKQKHVFTTHFLALNCTELLPTVQNGLWQKTDSSPCNI